ncbi:MAG: hypothetical protein KJN71_03650 [Acidimicrobiia bacterium]|nr:hypothetical protein [Acidimicrobiia bacterium]NNF65058.1 hypothetical protein [Acidimicrobiia bacterium]
MSESPWRVALALILIGSMAGGALWLLLSDRQGDSGLGSVPPPVATSIQTSDTSQPGESDGSAVASSPTSTTTGLASDESAILLAATNALTAWGEFAVSGDLAIVQPYFATDGLQMEQFRDEAPALAADPAGPPPYDFLLSDPSVAVLQDSAVVSVFVVMSRAGEPDQMFDWDISLIRDGTDWLVWTVSDRAG